jgi:uroporphyrinogen decarboxylase
VNNQAAVVGFVGSPWTLATYLIEGGSTSLYKTIKTMCFSAPEVLDALLTKLADAMAGYIKYQIRAGAQCVQIFDSWGGQLPPREWEKWVSCSPFGEGAGDSGGVALVCM